MDADANSLLSDILRDPDHGAARLVDTCHEPLFALAMSLCHDRMTSEDLVFRTFETAIRRASDCRDGSAFLEWMKAILRNEWRMSVRRGMVRSETPMGGSDDIERIPGAMSSGGDIERAVDGDFVRDAIGKLSPEAREVLIQRYFLDMPVGQIARFLRLPVGTVKSRLHYARLALAAKLGTAANTSRRKAAVLALAVACIAVLGAAVVHIGGWGAAPAESVSSGSEDFQPEAMGEATSLLAAVSAETRQDAASPSAGFQSPVAAQTEAASLPNEPSALPDTTTPFSTTTQETNTMKRTKFFAASLAALAPLAAISADYDLPAGKTDTFSDGAVHTYETATVAGDLAILSNTKFTATTAVNLAGGTVTVNGNSSVFGHRSNRGLDPGVTATFSPAAADGRYTKVSLQNGVAYGFAVGGVSDYANFAARKLVIEADTAATRDAYPDGVFDFLETTGSGGCANFCEVENNSSLTGRVHVAATSSMFGCGNGNANGAGFFKTGNFLIDVDSGKTLRFNANDKGYSYNQAGCNVLATGAGNLLFIQRFNLTWVKTALRSGAVMDVTGTITFDCSSTTSGAYGWFTLADDCVFGPNVGKIMTADVVGKNPVFLEVPTGVAVTVHDVEVKRDGDGLVGAGTVRIDASAAARTFEANIPANYGSGTANTLSIAKTGANEVELVVANLPSLVVEEGVARITTNCVVGALSGASGATLVADGCTVTLPAVSALGGLALATANGGAFQSASGRAMLYGPGTLDGALRIASGDFAASAYGLPQKFLRWTFSKTVSSPNPLHIARLWVFGSDGGRVVTGLVEAIENDNTAASSIRAGRVAWEYSSATNIAASSSQWFYGKGLLHKVFNKDFTTDHNHYPHLTSPVVDPGNSDSWIGFTVHRKSGEANATGYNIEIGNYANAPSSWTVEASDDGETWTRVDVRENLTPASTTAETLYDGETAAEAQTRGAPLQHFLFSGYVSGGLAADAAKAVTLQVDEGASVDLTAFTESPQKIDGLVVDFAAGGGTVEGGAIAPGGTLCILNGAQGFAFGAALPITLSGVTDADNLDDWSIVIDGVGSKGRVKLDADGHPVVVPFGTVVFFR